MRGNAEHFGRVIADPHQTCEYVCVYVCASHQTCVRVPVAGRAQAYTTFKASLFHAEALAQIGRALHSEGAVGRAIPVFKQASSFLLGTREVCVCVRALCVCMHVHVCARACAAPACVHTLMQLCVMRKCVCCTCVCLCSYSMFFACVFVCVHACARAPVCMRVFACVCCTCVCV